MLELNRIYNHNCLQTMELMEDNSVDLILTSPPYDNLRTYTGEAIWTFNTFKLVATEMYRVMKEGGIAVWVVGDATLKGTETCTSFHQAIYFKTIGFNLHDTMIYQKDNPVPTGGNNRYYQSFEYMFVLSKGTPKTFNPIMKKRRNKHNDKRKYRIKATGRQSDGTQVKKLYEYKETVKLTNVWTYPVGGGVSVENGVNHPATFPIKLAEDQILSWTNEGDLVYDPFIGSGTTAIAARVNNRNFLGSEVSKEYVDVANERIKNYFHQN